MSDHGHSHGPEHAAGGHGAAVAKPSPGHAEIPSAPLERSISPAPEDFQNLPGPSSLVWPFLWVGAAALAVAALLSSGWHPWTSEHGAQGHGAGDSGSGSHGAPHEAPPEAPHGTGGAR